MNPSPSPIPLSLMRGGTSKGPILRLSDVPNEGRERDSFLVRLMGSTDTGQVDGLGGGTSTTSKVMLVGEAASADHDIEYLFAQVDPRQPVVDYGGNCGNMTAAVALYAVLEAMVQATAPSTAVRMLNLNTNRSVLAHVPSDDVGPLGAGNHYMPGLSAPGAPIVTDYLDPEGSVFADALPTGSPLETLVLPDGREVDVSVVDAASPVIFLRALDIGLRGTEPPEAIDGSTDTIDLLETVRGCVAERLGLVDTYQRAKSVSPGIPKIAIVSPPHDYRTTQGRLVASTEVDIVARIMSVQRAHPTFSMTGLICTAVAGSLAGTIPHEVVRNSDAGTLRLGHPEGVVEAEILQRDEKHPYTRARVVRTARRLMHGSFDPPR